MYLPPRLLRLGYTFCTNNFRLISFQKLDKSTKSKRYPLRLCKEKTNYVNGCFNNGYFFHYRLCISEGVGKNYLGLCRY